MKFLINKIYVIWLCFPKLLYETILETCGATLSIIKLPSSNGNADEFNIISANVET